MGRRFRGFFTRSWRRHGDDRATPRRPIWWKLSAGFSCLVCALAILFGLDSRGAVYPSLFVDAYGCFSAVDLPHLDTSALHLNNTDRLIAIDGVPLDCPIDGPGSVRRCVQERFDEIWRDGRRTIALTFDRRGKTTTIERRLDVISPEEVIPLLLIYVLAGLLALTSGHIVLGTCRASAGTNAYAVWTCSSAIFFFTFFDYHTSAWLTPLFSASTVGVELAFVWLAFAFPSPIANRAMPLALWALTAAGLALALWLVSAASVFHCDPTIGRLVAGLALGPSAAALFVGTLVRMWRADKARRRRLRAAAVGFVSTTAFLAVGFTVALATGLDIIHAFLPIIGAALPLSIGHGLLRHDELGARSAVSRAVFELPAATFAFTVGALVWREVPGTAGAVLGLTAGCLLLLVAGGVLAPRLFPARKTFRRLIMTLGDELGVRRTPDQVAQALSAVVESGMDVRSARVTAGGDAAAAGLPVDRLRDTPGAIVRADSSPGLLVPLRAAGELHAVLELGPRRDGAPFNQEDVALIDTMAGFGGLALHHASVLEQLEELRRLQLDAADRDKHAALALLGAEVAHEVSYSIGYFNALFPDGEAGGEVTLSGDDVVFARAEVARLQRMLSALRRLSPQPALDGPVDIAGPLATARVLIREQVIEKRVTLDVEGADDLIVHADRDQLIQVLANLSRNAVQAVEPGGTIAIRCAREDDTVVIRVIDDGPGVADDVRARLFQPWTSGRAGGTGLGLAVTARIVQSWRGTIRYERRDDRTEFIVSIPAGDA